MTKCSVCGNGFTTTDRRIKICSDECRKEKYRRSARRYAMKKGGWKALQADRAVRVAIDEAIKRNKKDPESLTPEFILDVLV